MWFIGVFGYVIFIKKRSSGWVSDGAFSESHEIKKGEIGRCFWFAHVQEATFFHIEAHNYKDAREKKQKQTIES